MASDNNLIVQKSGKSVIDLRAPDCYCYCLTLIMLFFLILGSERRDLLQNILQITLLDHTKDLSVCLSNVENRPSDL
jgi:hypothetical protein